jgi:hypothetical protein
VLPKGHPQKSPSLLPVLPKGIYATIDIDFHVYPRKSVYFDPDKAWCLPFSEATRRVKIFNPNNERDYQNAATYVYAFSDALMSVIRLCVQYDVTEIRQACFAHGLLPYHRRIPHIV